MGQVRAMEERISTMYWSNGYLTFCDGQACASHSSTSLFLSHSSFSSAYCSLSFFTLLSHPPFSPFPVPSLYPAPSLALPLHSSRPLLPSAPCHPPSPPETAEQLYEPECVDIRLRSCARGEARLRDSQKALELYTKKELTRKGRPLHCAPCAGSV